MWNPSPLATFVTLPALCVSLVQSRVFPRQLVSSAQSSGTAPPLPTPSNKNLFTPDFYEFLKSGNVSPEGNNPDPKPSAWIALGDSFAAGPVQATNCKMAQTACAGAKITPYNCKQMQTYQVQTVQMVKSRHLHLKLAPAMSQRTLRIDKTQTTN
ncbi:hypothetical protein HBI56_079720 [Parastagonospora nodorum]|nr:hypothetical protein HBH53_057340 [Parastagonospora nodorum]KAH3978566.1 hypothetical protein HBH51_066380 [Parastagonospora nodorum]KAH4017178.1 hypothetical protein HBI09_197920 [Parastagonospora nodorum]KAH4049534.1 hypothetical protein HBH49_147950 [Parastagonospora nodorum]KAH4122743.1 hypothetical protein HBH47_085550 [Parastagonospora nodorum]